jgi:hypothetical protein
VAAEIAYPRSVEQFVPTTFQDSGPAHLLAAVTTRHGSGNMCATNAETLTQMNIPLANVISDLGGVTGQLTVRAIVGGNATRGRSRNSVIPGFSPVGEKLPKA